MAGATGSRGGVKGFENPCATEISSRLRCVGSFEKLRESG